MQGAAEGGWGGCRSQSTGPTGRGSREPFRSPAPLFLPGRRDSSGIRLHYTATLRRFDAGIMELGLVYSPVMAIPPRETAFVLTVHPAGKRGWAGHLTLPRPGSPGWGPTGGSHPVYSTCRPALPRTALKTRLSFRE